MAEQTSPETPAQEEVKTETPEAAPVAEKTDKLVTPAFEVNVTSPDLAGREMAAVAPANDDGSRQAYHEAKSKAAENTAASSPKMGDSGANSTNP
jgi:hypothetical protein